MEEDTRQAGLKGQVREKFIELAMERKDGSSARAHSRLLGQFQSAWRSWTNNFICLLCLSRPAFNCLRCDHRFCDTCVIISGALLLANSSEILVDHCPLCGQPHGELVLLRPPTAGLRMLELGGTSQDKWEMLKFLKELRSITGLGISLREQFDLVVGSGIGKKSYLLT